MTALAALIRRDIRIALRVGGGALIGVLFFLTVVVLMPFAVGLDHAGHLPAAYLSAGQQRRLSLARLIAVRRPVWLLDEPTAALDAAGQSLFSALMRDHLGRGGLVVAATHTALGIEARELRIGGVA